MEASEAGVADVYFSSQHQRRLLYVPGQRWNAPTLADTRARGGWKSTWLGRCAEHTLDGSIDSFAA
jgi:hypothetical protein